MAVLTENKQTVSEMADALLKQVEESRTKVLKELKLGEEAYNLGEWVTVKKYAEKFGIDVHVVYNWIRRDKIPEDNILIVEELNGLTLIKAVPYKD